MEDFEISPSITNPQSVGFGLFAVGITLSLGIFVLPDVIGFYSSFPDNPSAKQMLAVIIGVIAFIWIMFIIVFASTIGKKIVVQGNLVYFKRRTAAGFGKWTIEKIIDFSRTVAVRDRKTATYVSTGKGIVPIIYYWLIFEAKDGNKQELLLNGWDTGKISNLFYFLRGRFPEVKFDTVILRDSPKKLSGITEV